MLRENCEYRNFGFLQRDEQESEEKDYKVRGYASTFEKYLLWDDGEYKVFEQIDPSAFDETDMRDVVFLLDHEGVVRARTKNGTIKLEVDEHGLLTESDLSATGPSRDAYDAIRSGLYDQMSFAFTVVDDDIYRENDDKIITRTIHKIGKIFDISAVAFPANPGTDIAAVSARSYFDGVIEAQRAERLAREQALEVAKAKYYYMEVKHD